ncbi:CoA-binding protein [Acidaminobacter sp. JC074]|uniref:CoA-binding protein n=1 Tax=Acidaminobacter sp. JC074 TaxID=2530199 RepID=UPI001F0EB024|nr:CoA-binding protein [Acidaminobacter sp. JC074]MCH4887849.1 CoA-binding protein [Acidaminobacter sp. JC074]
MTILKKNFFPDDQVLFIGVSRDPKSFSRSVYKDFIKSGIQVYPVNKSKFNIDGNQVFTDVNQIPHTPACAYILLNKDNTRNAVQELQGRGIKKILFHSKKTVDQETLDLCKSMDIEAVIACPKMMINPFPLHKIHGFIAGVR